jgi:cell division protein ZapA
MSEEARPVTVAILDKDYVVGCKEHEHESLYSAVEIVRHQLEELRVTGKVVGNERLAVMAALNIAHELLEQRKREEAYHARIDAFMRRVDTKLAGLPCAGEEALA